MSDDETRSLHDRAWRMFWRVYGSIHGPLKRPLQPVVRLTRLLIGPPYYETLRGMVMPALKAKCASRNDGSKPFLMYPNKYRSKFVHGTAIFEWSDDAQIFQTNA